MAEPESLNTMDQNSFTKIGDGSYARQNVGPSAQYVTSVTDTDTKTAPTAGQTIAVTPQLQPGVYELECITFIGGTTVANLEATNMRLLVGAAAIGRIMNPVPGTAGGVGTGQLRVRYVVNNAATASIVAVAAGTAGSVYSASIVAKRIL